MQDEPLVQVELDPVNEPISVAISQDASNELLRTWVQYVAKNAADFSGL
jgi:hypothetical protein